MIEVCRYCRTTRVVPGPRNEKRWGLCRGAACRLAGLQALAAEDLLTREEADELHGLLT